MFASTLGTGSVAAWGYGQRFADIPLTIIGGAFGTTFLPTFATQVSEDQKPAASRTWSEIIPRISFLLVPVAVILIVLRVPLIAFVFERGSFDQNSTLLSSLVLAGLALGLPLRAVGGLVMRGLPAFKTRSVPALLSLISTGSNIIFDFALIGVLGLFGIALSASLADMLFAMVGAIFFVRWLGSASVTRVARSLAKIVVAGIGMGLVTFGMITQGVYPHVDSRLASLLLQLGVPLAAAAVSYGLLAYALRIEESRAVLDHLTGRIAQWLQQRPIQPEG
jgi:putative peptidoglycan lipid II flippase